MERHPFHYDVFDPMSTFSLVRRVSLGNNYMRTHQQSISKSILANSPIDLKYMMTNFAVSHSEVPHACLGRHAALF